MIKVSESEVIEKYKVDKSSRKVAAFFGIGTTTVLKILKRNNIQVKNRKIIDKKSGEEIVDLYNSGETAKEISRLYPFCYEQIKKYLKKNAKLYRGNKRYLIKDKYFESINTPIKAYIYGILLADGNNSKSMRSVFLELKNEDKYILEKIRDEIYEKGFAPPIYSRIWKGKEYNKLHICSTSVSNSLMNFGIFPNKSLSFIYPEWLPNNLFPFFLRGFFDGDGSVGFYKDKHIKVYAYILGTQEFLEKIKNILHSEFFIASGKIISSQKNTPLLKRLTITSFNDLGKFYNLIYTNGCSLYLIRKRKIFDAMMKEISVSKFFNKKKGIDSNVIGVCFDRSRNKWMVNIKKKFIGRYNTKEEAEAVAADVWRKLNA